MADSRGGRGADETARPGSSAVAEGRAAAPGSDHAPADVSGILRAFRGDKILLAKLVYNFIEDLPGAWEKVKRAFAVGDADALEDAAHSLRGMVVIFGAHAAEKLILEFEARAKESAFHEMAQLASVLDAELERLVAFLREAAAPDQGHQVNADPAPQSSEP